MTGATGAQGPKGDKGDPGSGGGGLVCTTSPNVYLVTAANGTQTCHGRYSEKGDGTVTDNQTGLMWEMKTGTVGIAHTADVHDVNNSYTWSKGNPWNPDGTLFTNFLMTLNADVSSDGTGTCFANHCDWRIPNIVELRGMVTDPCNSFPCIDPAVGPTQASNYWSSSSLAGLANYAWSVYFNGGTVGTPDKADNVSARAVRSSR